MLETLIEFGDLRGRLPELGHLETVTPLYVAILRDDLAAMRVLLDAGADVKHTNVYGQLPLHVAAENGKSIEFVDLLIQAGADIWATSSNWRRAYPVESALYAFNKHPDVARRLLGAMLETEDRAADPDWKDQVLHTAVLYNQCGSADIVQTLLDNGADVFSRSAHGKTPIELLPLNDRHSLCLDLSCWGHNEPRNIATILFQTDPHLWPLEHINRQLWECLRGADCVEPGQIALFSLLIQSGESALDVVGPEGFKALHYLCHSAFLSHPYSQFQTHEPVSIFRMVSILLDNGASVVTRSDSGQSPLYFAAQLPCPYLLTLFLEKRPNCLIEDNDLHAKRNSHPYQTVPLFAAVRMGDLERVKILLDHGADISISDEYGSNALCYALSMRPICKSIIEVLIEAILAVPEHRRTWGISLTRAIETRNREAIDMLLEARASPSKNSIGWTALRYAAISRDAKTLGILIQRWGRTLVLSDDCRSGVLVCTVLRGGRSNSRSFTRDPELLKIAKSVVDYGAVVHQHCCACVSWKEEFGIECDMV
jgi:ankyrin repeat protein